MVVLTVFIGPVDFSTKGTVVVIIDCYSIGSDGAVCAAKYVDDICPLILHRAIFGYS